MIVFLFLSKKESLCFVEYFSKQTDRRSMPKQLEDILFSSLILWVSFCGLNEVKHHGVGAVECLLRAVYVMQ